MRWLTKKKQILASSENIDLKNKTGVEWDYFFLDFNFSIGGSVHAELVAYSMEKEAVEKQKMDQLQTELQKSIEAKPIDEIKNMNLSEETVRKVEQTLEEVAKSKVTQIQGQYYETYD